MSEVQVKIYTFGSVLPPLSSVDFFHSPELFHIIGNSSGQRPYMVVAFGADNSVLAHLLAIVRRRSAWLPPFIYSQGRVYGEGVYADDIANDNVKREEIFRLMLQKLTYRLRRKLCFYIEFSNLTTKMFGYRHLRREGYIPINWQEVHNSLHSLPPAERLTQKMTDRISRAYELGVETRKAQTAGEVRAFYRLIKGFYRFRLRRYIPGEDHFQRLNESDNGQVFITLYHGKVIGGCACVFSAGNAYLWYMASKRKRHPLLHPDILTVWHAIEWSWQHNYAHIFFLDAGLPFWKNPYREFILSFGGKPVAKYRWFRFNTRITNKIVEILYKE